MTLLSWQEVLVFELPGYRTLDRNGWGSPSPGRGVRRIQLHSHRRILDCNRDFGRGRGRLVVVVHRVLEKSGASVRVCGGGLMIATRWLVMWHDWMRAHVEIELSYNRHHKTALVVGLTVKQSMKKSLLMSSSFSEHHISTPYVWTTKSEILPANYLLVKTKPLVLIRSHTTTCRSGEPVSGSH